MAAGEQQPITGFELRERGRFEHVRLIGQIAAAEVRRRNEQLEAQRRELLATITDKALPATPKIIPVENQVII